FQLSLGRSFCNLGRLAPGVSLSSIVEQVLILRSAKAASVRTYSGSRVTVASGMSTDERSVGRMVTVLLRRVAEYFPRRLRREWQLAPLQSRSSPRPRQNRRLLSATAREAIHMPNSHS